MKLLILQHFFPIYILTFIFIWFSDAKALDQSTHKEGKLNGNPIRYREDISEYVDEEECYPVGLDKKRICRRGHVINTNPNESIPISCKEVLDRGYKASGVYQIQPIKTKKPINVLCDMETRGGGWTHIQKRYDESQDFDRNLREYKFGFGDLAGEFWFGLEHIHQMTTFTTNELLVEITDRDNITKYANYKIFQVGPEVDGYALNTLEDYTGDAGDSLTYSLGSKFTTKDFHRDSYSSNCAVLCLGGWWFKDCYYGYLNGKNINTVLPTYIQYSGIQWTTFHTVSYSNAGSRMLIRTL